MPEQIPYDRLMALCNRVLIYVLERGAGQPKGYVPLDEMKRELDLQRDEYRAVYLNLHQADLAHTNATNAAIYLTDEGRLEAEKIKAGDGPGAGSMHIDARYSVVQIAGAGSTQTASLSIDQQRVLTLVEEIEQKLPNLTLSPAERDEASSLAEALRKAVRELPAAGARAIVGRISSPTNWRWKRFRAAPNAGALALATSAAPANCGPVLLLRWWSATRRRCAGARTT